MRSHFTRLSLVAGAMVVALGGCNDAINGVPVSGSPNSAGGGVVNTNAGLGTVPANTIATKSIDDGTVSKGKYAGFNTSATDTQSGAEVPTDATKLPVLPNPSSPSGTTDLGSHAVTFSGNGSTQVILGWGGTVPNLTYSFGQAGNTATYTYSTIVFHGAYQAGTTSPGSLSGVALEFTGGSGASAYDVRVPCTLPTQPSTATPAPVASGATAAPTPAPIVALPAAFTPPANSLVTCSGLPAYPLAGFLGNGPNTTGPNAVTPGVTGQFTPTAPKMYVVLTYASGTPAASSATLDIDYLYAKQ